MATITGVAGSAINAVCTVSNSQVEIGQVESSATAQSICNDLATIKSGDCTISGAKTFSGSLISSGTLYTSARRRKRARVSLTDADHTVAHTAGSGVTDVGTRFVLANAATVTRTVTLKSTTVVPDANEIYEFIFPASTAGISWTSWTFEREDATTIASFVPFNIPAGGRMVLWAEFEFTGGVWRLAGNSGMWTDIAGPTDYGVVPGAGM
jgi:hypothetical protein